MAAGHHRSRALALLAAVALGLSLLVAASPSAEAVTGCITDDGDDEEFARRPGRPQADVLAVCLDWDATAMLLIRPAVAPAASEPAAYGDLDVLFGVGDPEFPDFTISVLLRDGRFSAQASRHEYDFEGETDEFVRTTPTCALPVRTTGIDVEVGPFDPGCIGGSAEINFFVSWLHSLDGFNEDRDGDWFPGAGYPSTAFAAPFGTRPTGRVFGASRIETAVAISRTVFSSSASVYLARADVVTDAVAGGALTDGPILLVRSCGEPPPPVREEIGRLSPDRVVALGGPGAVCDELLTSAAAGRSTSRLAGESRVTTSIAIAREAFADGAEELYLARSSDPVDAVAGGALTLGPIVVVPDCGEVPDEVRQLVVDLAPQRVVALGGPGAVCDQVLTEVADGRAVARLSGPSRVETALEIARFAYPSAAPTVFVAREDNVADAVAGGVLPGAPLLLVPGCGTAPDAVLGYAQQGGVQQVVALGGPGAVCDFSARYVAGPVP